MPQGSASSLQVSSSTLSGSDTSPRLFPQLSEARRMLQAEQDTPSPLAPISDDEEGFHAEPEFPPLFEHFLVIGVSEEVSLHSERATVLCYFIFIICFIFTLDCARSVIQTEKTDRGSGNSLSSSAEEIWS